MKRFTCLPVCSLTCVFVLWDKGNFIDTANKYQEGETEEWLGDFIQKRGKRDDLVIATKYSLPMPVGSVTHVGNHRKNMFQALQKSLERLQTDYIDLYYGRCIMYASNQCTILMSTHTVSAHRTANTMM